METWFIIVVSISISLLIKLIIEILFSSSVSKKHSTPIPPGPTTYPIIGNAVWLGKSFADLELIIRSLHFKLGPLITLHIGSRPSIFVADRSLAYQALVQNGAVFADRPRPLLTGKIISSNQHTISSASYGANWRLFRRNLTAEILHPLRVNSYSHARKSVLDILIDSLKSKGHPVQVMVHFQYAMFCLLVFMCFGDEVDQEQIKQIEEAQRRLLLSFGRFTILNFWPKVTKVLMRKRWEEFFKIRGEQERVLTPLIRARRKLKGKNKISGSQDEFSVLSYVDTLLNLELPEENKRKLSESDMVSLCSEFLNAGTDTTSTALQWIMANLVKSPNIQETLYTEMKGVVGEGEEEVKEEDLHKMPYLKAIVLEGLRRHPPGHFVLPHSVTEDTVLGGFLVPKNGTINFMVADMGWDPKVWEDPMEFKPERFVKSEGFDISCSREIKMMPFGVGRRMCPGFNLAILHLEYFVANLVWNFEWKITDAGVDLSEKQEFTMVMKYPLQANISKRKR